MDNQLFIAKYQLELPKKEEMQRFIDEQLSSINPDHVKNSAGQRNENV